VCVLTVLGGVGGFSCKSALENCSSRPPPPPLPAKRAAARRGEFRARKNGISEDKITPGGKDNKIISNNNSSQVSIVK